LILKPETISEVEEKKLYTLLVYSENIAGILNQITAVFTRRQVNIESLNVSASSIPHVHKYTITAYSDEDQIVKITKQIEKKIDVVKANYYTDEELFIREVGLYKLSTPVVLESPEISRLCRRADAHIMEVNPTFCSVMLSGKTEEITDLYYALDKFGCVLQYTRSGRIAVTRSTVEQVSDFLDEQERQRQKRMAAAGEK
jgi:acetolactate synthase-1/3 small subunit